MLMNAPLLFEVMKREKVHAVVATTPENVTYASGYWSLSQWIRRGPQIYVLIPAQGGGDSCIITNTGGVDLIADQEVWVSDIRRYGFLAIEQDETVLLSEPDRKIAAMMQAPDDGDAVGALVRAIKERGLENGRIGIDEQGILPEYQDRLAGALPGATLIRASHVFRRARTIKTSEEVRRLRDSAQIAEKSIESALSIACPGVTEEELAHAFHATTIKAGGTPVLGCIGAGPRSAMVNVQPSRRKLRQGDVIRFDVGGRYQHYRADIARNGVLGEPSKKIDRYHRAIRAGLERAYELVRPGVPVASVFEEVVQTVCREGITHYRRNHVGHGIGLDGYDPPNITSSSKEVFEEGMVICLETPYYELGFAGLQVEDTIHVTKDGLESLMSTGFGLRII